MAYGSSFHVNGQVLGVNRPPRVLLHDHVPLSSLPSISPEFSPMLLYWPIRFGSARLLPRRSPYAIACFEKGLLHPTHRDCVDRRSPCRDFQQPPDLRRSVRCRLHLQGLPDRGARAAQDHDARAWRVHPPLPHARPAKRAFTASATTACSPMAASLVPRSSPALDSSSTPHPKVVRRRSHRPEPPRRQTMHRRRATHRWHGLTHRTRNLR
jgi:hypothetical protein